MTKLAKTLAMPPALGLCALFVLGGCGSEEAPATRVANSYKFALVGDMPYYADPTTSLPPEFVAAQYAAVLQEIDDADVEFVVHVGDTNSSLVCADSVYAERYAEFEALGHPVFYTPGDNEWLECDNAGLDPMEQLEQLRAVFMGGDESLGGRKLPLERQSSRPGYEKFRENVRWRFGGDLYVTLHVVGGGGLGGRADACAHRPGDEGKSRIDAGNHRAHDLGLCRPRQLAPLDASLALSDHTRDVVDESGKLSCELEGRRIAIAFRRDDDLPLDRALVRAGRRVARDTHDLVEPRDGDLVFRLFDDRLAPPAASRAERDRQQCWQ